jgi:hypothetical protein
MFGVCEVWVDFGGSGYYVGGVCRTSRFWWSGLRWLTVPINPGPFATRELAEAFAARQRILSKRHIFVYAEGDPFGERVEL